MLIQSITLTRKKTGNLNNLFGILEVKSANHGKFYFSTVENDEYKIKEGTYPIRYTWSNRFNSETLQLIGTGDRTGIRIHPANRGSELRGCIGLGLANNNKEIPQQIHNSRLSVEIFEQLVWRDTKQEIKITSDYENSIQNLRKNSNGIITQVA